MRNGNPSTHRAAVGLVRCAGYEEYAAVRTAVRESFDLFGGIAALVRPGQRVLLKPNLLSALPAEAGVNTHPSVVRAVAEEALEAGGVLSIGDSPAFSRLDDTAPRAASTRWPRLGIPIVPFNRPVWVPARAMARRASGRPRHPGPDVVINIPAQVARAARFTAAAKNLYGCMPGKRKAWSRPCMATASSPPSSPRLRDRRPAFNLVDAILAMHRPARSGATSCQSSLLVGDPPFAVDTFLSRLIAIPDADN